MGNDIALALAIHVLSVVLWIGGVGFVTTVVFPVIRSATAPRDRLNLFLRVEHRFVWQARISVLFAGASGLYMVYRMKLWSLFSSAHAWWMHAMVCLWLIFFMMLFVIEPFVLHRKMVAAAQTDESSHMFARMARMHWVLFVLSIITVFAAAGGSHGLF